jgi:hypothetical protein
MADFWPPHLSQIGDTEPHEDARGYRVLHEFIKMHKNAGTIPREWDFVAVLSAVVIDLEERLIQMQRRLNELDG